MKTRFVLSAPSYDALPRLTVPEFAFAGRSNVGKSSLLNMLFQRHKLVRASKTPGRTQLLNLFMIDEHAAFVDLPGYGYAKLSLGERQRMENMIRNYLMHRDTLSGVVLLLDARREGDSVLDAAMVEWLLDAGRRILVVVTKMDLISKAKQKPLLRSIEKKLGLPEGCAIACSAKTGMGRDELLQRLNDWVEQ